MGQYGTANITIQLKNINLMKPANVTDYSRYSLLQTFITRIKHNGRTKTNSMLYTLLKQPSSQSNNLLKFEKYIKSIQTYPNQHTADVVSVYMQLEGFSLDFVKNIANAININLNNHKIARVEKIIQTEKLINLYPNQYENIEDKYYSFIDSDENIFNNPTIPKQTKTEHGILVPYNSEHSFSPKLTIDLSDNNDKSQFYKHYIFTYLYQNYNYTDETLQTPIDVRGTKYTINLNEVAEIIIRVNKTRSFHVIEGTGEKVSYMLGTNKYLVQLKSTDKISNTEEYKTIPLDIEISPAIVTPYIFTTSYSPELKENTDYSFKNEVWGIDIQILFNYYDSKDKLITKRLIPFSFILDKGMIQNYDNDDDDENIDIPSLENPKIKDANRIIKPSLLYNGDKAEFELLTYLTMVNNVRNILTNIIHLIIDVNKKDTQINTLPNISLIAIDKTYVHADIRVGKVKEQESQVTHACYPTEYYLPAYTGSDKPNPNYRGTKWEYVKLFNTVPIDDQEKFVKQRKKDELKLRKIFKKIGIDLETLAFSEYHSGHTFISKTTNKKMVMQKFPFRSLFGRNELNEDNITIPNGAGNVYFKRNSSAIFSGLEFSLSLYKGKDKNKMTIGEVAYVYHFIEMLILQINKIKELQPNQEIKNIILQSSYGYHKNYVTKYLAINSISNIYDNKNNNDKIKFKEYKNQYNKHKNKYWINFINNNNLEICLHKHENKIIVLNTRIFFKSTGYVHFNKEDIRVFVDGIKKSSDSKYVNSIVDNISLLSESQDTGIAIPISIEAYKRVPPYLRLNTYVNSSTLALYSIGLGASVGVAKWVGVITKVFSILLLAASILLTAIFPPAGAWGIAGAVTGILGGVSGFVTNILVDTGIISPDVAAIISIAVGAISLVTVVGVAFTIPANLLNISNTIVQGISLTTEIVTKSIDMSYRQSMKKLAEQRNSFLSKVNKRQDEYDSIIDKYRENEQLTMSTLMDIFYGDEYSITPTQFFNLTKTIGFDYNMLYRAGDDISNYVSNCLRLK